MRCSFDINTAIAQVIFCGLDILLVPHTSRIEKQKGTQQGEAKEEVIVSGLWSG